MRSFKTFLSEQKKYTDRPQAQLQGPAQMPQPVGAGTGGGAKPAPRVVRKPFQTLKGALERMKKQPLQAPISALPPGPKREVVRGLAALGVAGTGYAGVSKKIGQDVGEYVSQTYPEDIKVSSLEAQKEFFKLPLADQMALATSKPALRDYLGPLAMGTGAAVATKNPLAAAIAATPPGLAARRSISGIGTSLGGAEDIQYGENPAAQDAARRYMERITSVADKKLKSQQAKTARREGIRQAIIPGYDTSKPKKPKIDSDYSDVMGDLF